MNRVLRLLGAYCAVVILTGCASLSTGRTATEWAHYMEQRGGFDLKLPEGVGAPPPVAVFFHGCQGRQQVEDVYAQRAREMGIATLVVDSLAPRGIQGRIEASVDLCTGIPVSGQARAADVLASLDWLRARQDVDSSRVLLMGFSHGAWAISDLLTMDLDRTAPGGLKGDADALRGVKGVVLMYPLCGLQARLGPKRLWRAHVPTLMALAGRDQVTFDDICLKIAPLLRRNNRDFVCHYFPDATHAFDEPRHKGKSSGRVQYSAEAAGLMLNGFTAFAGEQLGLQTSAVGLEENCPVAR